MARREYQERVILISERLNPEHPFGPLVPMGRFDWERILNHCIFKPNSAKLVGYAMATFADLETGERIFPGNKRIGAITSASRSTVERGIEALEKCGLLHQVSSGSSYGRAAKASEYRLTAPEVLAFEYRDEMNAGTWNAPEKWEPEAMFNMTELINQAADLKKASGPNAKEHASPMAHVSQDHASPVTHEVAHASKEHASNSREHASNFHEHASPLNRTCVTSEDPRTYRSDHQSMNQEINESSSAAPPNASLEGSNSSFGSVDDESEISIEQRYAAARDFLQTLKDHGAGLVATVEESHPDLSLTQRVIEAANLARQRKGKAA